MRAVVRAVASDELLDQGAERVGVQSGCRESPRPAMRVVSSSGRRTNRQASDPQVGEGIADRVHRLRHQTRELRTYSNPSTDDRNPCNERSTTAALR